MEDSEGRVKKFISRRELLKLWPLPFLVGAAAGTAGSLFFKDEITAGFEHLFLKTEIAKLDEEEKRLTKEIGSFRTKLGLPEFPAEMVDGFMDKNKWEGIAPAFKIDLPERLKDYGLRTGAVLSFLYGKNATRLVKGIKVEKETPFVMSFSGRERYCLIPFDTDLYIPLKSFSDFILHEAAGHGIDPGIEGARYPLKELISVEHGKWQALSRMFSIEGQFMRHPEDMMYPRLTRNLGAVIGFDFVEQDLKDTVSGENKKMVENIISDIAREEKREAASLVFNKRRSRKLGGEVVERLLKGEVTIKGDAKNVYQVTLEGASREIFAEMVKMAVKYPGDIGNDHEIVEGIKEVVVGIKGVDRQDVDLADVNAEIMNLESVHFKSTPEPKDQPTEEIPVVTPAPEALDDEMAAIEKTVEIKQDAFLLFISEGKLQKEFLRRADPDTVSILIKYGQACSKVIGQHPVLRDSFFASDHEEFDPELHYWEILKIEEAVNTDFIKNVIIDASVARREKKRIEDYTKILENFIASAAFGT